MITRAYHPPPGPVLFANSPNGQPVDIDDLAGLLRRHLHLRDAFDAGIVDEIDGLH